MMFNNIFIITSYFLLYRLTEIIVMGCLAIVNELITYKIIDI